MAATRRLVRVEVVECDLGPLAVGSIDTFVSGALIRVNDEKEIKDEKGQSEIAKSNDKPIFKWTYMFGNHYNLGSRDDGNPRVRLTVTQKKSGLMSKKVPLCFVDVDVDDLIASQGESGAADQASASSSSSSPPAPPAQWYDMDLASGAKVKGAGPARMKLKASIVQKSSASASDFRGDVPDVDDDDKEDIDFVIDKFNSNMDKKKKRKMTKDTAANTINMLLNGKAKRDLLIKRFEKECGAKAKDCTSEQFVNIYRSLKSTAPNELQIVALRATNLRAADTNLLTGGGKSDPFIRFKLAKHTQKTKVIKKTLNPTWNEKFSFKCTDASLALEVLVYDWDQLSDDFLGRTTIPIKSLINADSKPKKYELRDSHGKKEYETRGEVELIVKWRYNASPDYAANITGDDSDSEDESDDDDDEDDEEEDGGADPDEKAKKQAEKKKEDGEEEKEDPEKSLKSQQKEFKIKSGDYQIHVHIIECRDLKPKDLNGMSDPVVSVEAFGQKMNTAVVSNTLNPVFDDLLIFNVKGLEREEFEEGIIQVKVKDSDLLTSNDIIGSYAFDATYVYYQADHELHKKWVGLINEVDVEDTGVQGYLKLSVQIVGPDDKLKIHTDDDDDGGNTDDNDISSMVLMPPTIKRQQKWLVITAHCAEYLPILDNAVGAAGMNIVQGGIDAYYKVEFSDTKISSKVVSIKGQSRHKMNPELNYQLWIPVTTPSMTNMVKHSVWDYDTSPLDPDDIAGMFTTKFKDVQKKGKMGPDWMNLYGAPTIKETAASTLVTKIGVTTNWKKKYNETPALGSTFRGRVLITQKVKSKLPKKQIKKEQPFAPWKKKAKPLEPFKYPLQETYVLKATVVSGSELPLLQATRLEKPKKLGVMVTCGKYELLTKPVQCDHGCADWSDDLSEEIELPNHETYPDAVPDIIIYLYYGKDAADRVPICFKRIPALEVMKDGFTGNFHWHTLQEDKVYDKLSGKKFPGCVLVRLGLGTKEQAVIAEQTWNVMADSRVLTTRVPYIVRVHIFQCRDLPAADSDGMIDPYLKINVQGVVKTSSKKHNTKDPMYYESYDFPIEIVHANGLQLAPRVSILLWDYDWGIMDGDDDYCGCCFIDIKENAFIDASPVMNKCTTDQTVIDALPKDLPPTVSVLRAAEGNGPLLSKDFPDPTWHDFMYEKEGDAEGQVLASVQLIPSSPGHPHIPESVDIKPASREAYLELTTLGCRNLIPYNFLPITLPRLDYVLETAEEKLTTSSPESKKPSPQNPNFLRYDVLKVEKFPIKSIFAPRLVVKAFDTRLGGLSKPNIGNCAVPLEHKLPWDLSTYIPPQVSFKAPPAEEEEKEEDDDDDDDDGAQEETKENEGDGEPQVDENGNPIAAIGDGARELGPNDDPTKFNALDPGVDFKTRVTELAGDMDTGAGVFGAFKHLEKEREKEEDLLALSFPDDLGEDDVEEDDGGPPKYMIDRQKLEGTYEEEFTSRPFESFNLMIGQSAGGLFGGTDTLRVAGVWKGLVRVLETEPGKDDAPYDLGMLLKPQSYKVRLYVLRGIAFAAMDASWQGRPGKSDPYLYCELGKELFDDRENYVEDARDVDFYKCVELNAELPGAGQLIINVKDFDTFGTDDLIGRTIIDLEDRWFDSVWQDLGSETKCDDPEKMRWKAKPLEMRPLYTPPETRKSQPQGHVELWVDILQPAEATAFPPDDVSLPPTAIFEARLVIWKAKNVVSMDSITHMNDTYVKAFIEGCDAQTTDIHWRAKKGKASWNWRMKFDVELGNRTRSMKFPYLNIQMWDKDILKYDDLIAETLLDLKKPFKKAYRKNKAVKLFTRVKKKGILSRFSRNKKASGQGDGDEEEEGEGDQAELGGDDAKNELTGETKEGDWEFDSAPPPPGSDPQGQAGGNAQAKQPGGGDDQQGIEMSHSSNPLVEGEFEQQQAKNTDDLEDQLFGKDDQAMATGETKDDPAASTASKEPALANGAAGATAPGKGTGAGTKPQQTQDDDASAKKNKKKKEKGKKKEQDRGCCSCGKKKEPVDSDDEEAMLLDEDDKEKQEDDEQAKRMISTVKGMVGLGEDDPPESDWLHMTKTDHEKDGERIPMGKLCISFQIMPKVEAKMNDNGFGRRAPNHSPLLPPPVGRLKWSWNPFVLGSQICGPKICFYFTCCCIVSIIIVLMIFCQPLMNLIIALCVKLLL